VSHCIISSRKPDVETPCSRGGCPWEAILALRAISEWPEGVAALADTEVFEEFQHLAQKESDCHPFEIGAILANVAQYKEGKTDAVHE
jgi:hypothetical protein